MSELYLCPGYCYCCCTLSWGCRGGEPAPLPWLHLWWPSQVPEPPVGTFPRPTWGKGPSMPPKTTQHPEPFAPCLCPGPVPEGVREDGAVREVDGDAAQPGRHLPGDGATEARCSEPAGAGPGRPGGGGRASIRARVGDGGNTALPEGDTWLCPGGSIQAVGGASPFLGSPHWREVARLCPVNPLV